MSEFEKIILICFLVLLVILSAFFSGSEIVYTTVNGIKLKKSMEAGNKMAKKAKALADDYPTLLSTILVGNNLVNIAASSAATMLAISVWGETNGPVIAVVGMTFLVLTFGEILPKTILVKYCYKVSLIFAIPIKICQIIFTPIVVPVTFLVSKMSKLWTPKETAPTATDEELITMVDEIEEEGFIDEDTGDLIRSAIDFTDSTVHEIMVPRVDIFAYDIEDDIDELIHDPNIFKYSRVPVYKDTIDNIVGVIKTKVLIRALLAKKTVNIDEAMTKPIFVHKTKSISSLLREFKKTHVHIAIVMDEFGGTLGLVTLEDILEELVGDIWDEMDTVEEEFEEKSEGEFIVDGDMNIYDFFELVEYDDKDFDSEYTTVGGWCTEVLERFPKDNDTFEFANLSVKILKVDGVRVEKVKVVVKETEEDEER